MAEYEAYKDSGAVWIGKIPAEWTVTRLKNHLRRTDARNPGGVQVLSLYRELGIVPKDSRDDNHNVTSEDTSNYKYVQPGDFVVNKMKAWQGSVAVSDYEGIVSPAYYVYKFLDNSFHKRYFHYLIRSCYKEEFMSLSAGIRIGQWDLSSQDLDNVPVLIPAMTEQTAIAAYLDKETKRIDAIIAEAKASIEEYKAWKASIIYEAVTKGLDPNVEMKDSGIERIGQIPAHWTVTKIKTVCRLKTGSTPATSNPEWFNGDIPWFTPGDFNESYYLSSSSRSLSQKAKDDNVAVNIPANTVLIVGIGATAGKIGFTLVEGSCNQQITALIAYKIDSRYLMYWMIANTKFIRETAMFTTLPILNNQTIGNYPIVVPYGSLEEQRQIADYLDIQSSRIEELIVEKYSLIEELEAYKKSLIFEVVTGKRKVV